MDERELAIRSDMLTLRSLAGLTAVVVEATMKEMGISDGLINEKRRYEILKEVYEGVIQLAVHLGSWEEALTSTRATCAMGHDDQAMRQAYEILLWQTNYLYM